MKTVRAREKEESENERISSIVIMDNASYHRSLKTTTELEWLSINVMMIPSHSPFLNPVEVIIGSIKRKLK